MKRILALAALAAVLAGPAWAKSGYGDEPAPRLFEPSDETDLKGKNELLFRWGGEGNRSVITDYQFKLYKGAKTVESAMIKKETVPSRQDRLSLPADLFENGGTYTWQLRGTGTSKTKPAYAVFNVSK